MKHLRILLAGALFFPLLFLFASQAAYSQVQTARYISMTTTTNGFYEYLPQGYDPSGSQTYPVIIFLHGTGEEGNGGSDLPKMLNTGLPKLINQNKFPTSFTVNGQTFKFIVISPQFTGWPALDAVDHVLDYVIQHYKVNTNRIYFTGLSMGGGVTWDYSGNTDVGYGKRVAAIVPIAGASYPSVYRAQKLVDLGIAVWATHNDGDPTVTVDYTNQYISEILAYKPTHPAKKTIFHSNSHDAWTQTYDPTFKENNMNVYEWMLQYQRNTTSTGNQLPTANAGTDKTITLPTNSVQLSGTGTDADGSISSYNWSKISGPSQFSISNSDISNPIISNLVAGTYVLRLTVKDNNGGIATDDINVTVNSNTPPTNGKNIPAKIEAESYDAMYGIRTETTTDAGGGLDVGYFSQNDWLDYAVNAASAGTYTVNFRVATGASGAQFQLRKSDGTILATLNVPKTGGYQTWQTISTTISLPAGNQTLRIFSTQTAGWNINWLEFVSSSTPPPTPDTSTKIEAENYTSMYGIRTETTTDAGGGLDVGYFSLNDWLDYSINPATAGTYTLNFRIATNAAGVQFQLKKSDGTLLTTINVPKTGGYQTWQTISTTVNLSAGSQTLRIFSNTTLAWNINWFELVSSDGTVTSKSTGNTETVEASSLQLYPNPVNDKFMLTVINDHIGTMNVSIFDINGAIIKTFSLSKDQTMTQIYLSATDLKAGNYVVKVQVGEWTETTKIIKL